MDQAVYRGTLADLSLVGGLFIPEAHVDAKRGQDGRLYVHPQRLGLAVRVVRVADVQTSAIPSVRGVGLEFLELKRQERSALERLLSEPG